MHWLWRALVAMLAAWATGRLLHLAIILAAPVPANDYFTFLSWTFMISYGIQLALALAVYGLLTRQHYARRPFDGETRCRKCGYILRGITEPRCSECGQRI